MNKPRYTKEEKIAFYKAKIAELERPDLTEILFRLERRVTQLETEIQVLKNRSVLDK